MYRRRQHFTRGLLVGSIVLAGCGRLSFDAVGDPEPDAGGSLPIDAGGQTVDAAPQADAGPSVPIGEVTSGPIIRASDSATDDSYHLIATRGSQRASSFVYDSRLYYSVPTKSSDSSAGGWHYAMLSWLPGDAEAAWIDGDPVTSGNQAMLRRNELDSNGFALRNHRATHYVQHGVSGPLSGLSNKFFSSTEYPAVGTSGFFWIGVSADAPDSVLSQNFLVDAQSVIDVSANDGTWRGETTFHADLISDGATVYIYQTQRNAPANDQHYIAVTRTSDMVAYQLPTDPLLTGYSRAQVFEHQGSMYMVAFSDAAERWQLIPGSGPESFDPSMAMNIELGAALHGTGEWDDTPLLSDLPGGEPRIAGVDVIGDRVYLSYLAGSFGQLTDDPQAQAPYNGVPYDGARGVGVLELMIP